MVTENNNNNRSGKNRNFRGGKKRPFGKDRNSSTQKKRGNYGFKHHQSPYLEPKDRNLPEIDGNIIRPDDDQIPEVNGNIIRSDDDHIPDDVGNRVTSGKPHMKQGQRNNRSRNKKNRRPNNTNPSNANRSENFKSNTSGGSKNRQNRRQPPKEKAVISDGPKTPSSKKISGVEGLFNKYDEYMEIVIDCRNKLFSSFSKAKENDKKKLEKNYFQSLENLKKWVRSLAPWQQEFLEKKTNPYPMDTDYSTNHPGEIQSVPQSGTSDDPHFTAGQKEAFDKYKDDVEETKGTIEDYQKYKGQ